MSETPYRYHGPMTGFTLGEGEFMARPGDLIYLPSDHPLTLAWVAQAYATPVETPLKRRVKEA